MRRIFLICNLVLGFVLSWTMVCTVRAVPGRPPVVVIPLCGDEAVGNAGVEDVLEGKTFSNKEGVGLVGTMPDIGQQNITPGTRAQRISQGYHNGKGRVAGDADLVGTNIRSGIDVFGVVGSVIESMGDAAPPDVVAGKTFSRSGAAGLAGTMPNIGAQNITPGSSAQTIAQGYHNGLGVVQGDADLASKNIRSGVSIFGVAGDPNLVNTSSGDAVPGDIRAGKKAWVDGSEVTGNVTQRSDVTGAPGSLTFPIPDGIYEGKTATAQDSDLSAANIRKDVDIFGVVGIYAPGRPLTGVEKTGQTGCWDSSGTSTSCTGTGQDGEYQKGVTWPSPRFTDNGDGTVTDNLTRLIWLKNTSCPGGTNWSDALTFANSLYDGWTGDPGGGDCGLSDGSSVGEWRLPNRKELLSLIDLGRCNPALPSGYPFTGVQSYYYWSSTTNAGYPGFAWYVDLYDGYADRGSKGFVVYDVWPVRGGQ
jgi:hypothetical protein